MSGENAVLQQKQNLQEQQTIHQEPQSVYVHKLNHMIGQEQVNQTTSKLGSVRAAVEAAMPGCFANINQILSSEDEKERTKGFHHARGTKLLHEGKNVLNLDMIGTFRQNIQSGNKYRTEKNNFKLKSQLDKKTVENDSIKELREEIVRRGANYLGNLFELWELSKDDSPKEDIHILLNGNKYAGSAALEGAMMIKCWVNDNYPQYLSKVKFELTQYNPLEKNQKKGPIDLKGDEIIERDGERMMSLGENAQTTVTYSLYGKDEKGSVPQCVKGAKRLILTAFDQDAGLAQQEGDHKIGYKDARTGEVYRGSGLNELDEGVYFLDENQTLVKMQSFEQAVYVMKKSLNGRKISKARFEALISVVQDCFGQSDMVQKENDPMMSLLNDWRTSDSSGMLLHKKDSSEMTNIKNSEIALYGLLESKVSAEGLEHLAGLYQELNDNCNHYLKVKKHYFTSEGERRYLKVREVLAYSMKMLNMLKENKEQIEEQLGKKDTAELSWRLLLHQSGIIKHEQAQEEIPEKVQEQPKEVRKNRISRQALAYIDHNEVWNTAEDKERSYRHSCMWRKCLLTLGRIPREMTDRQKERKNALEKFYQLVVKNMKMKTQDNGERIVAINQLDLYEKNLQKDKEAATDEREKEEIQKLIDELQEYYDYIALKKQGAEGLLDEKEVEQAPEEQKFDYTKKDKTVTMLLMGKRLGDAKCKSRDAKDLPLFSHEPSVHDIKQGGLGDCYLLSALAAIVSMDPVFIKQSMREDKNGNVTVRFYKKDEKSNKMMPFYVTVSKEIIAKDNEDGKDAFAKGSLWVQMYEKAYAASGLHATLEKEKEKYHVGKSGKYKNKEEQNAYEECRLKLKEKYQNMNPPISEKQIENEAREWIKHTYAAMEGTATMEFLQFLTGKQYEEMKFMNGSPNKIEPGWKDMIAQIRKERENASNEEKAENIILESVMDSVLHKLIYPTYLAGDKDDEPKDYAHTIERIMKRVYSGYKCNKETFMEKMSSFSNNAQKLLNKNNVMVSDEKLKETLTKILSHFEDYMDKYGYFQHEAFASKEDGNQVKTGKYTNAANELYKQIEGALEKGGVVVAGTKMFHNEQEAVTKEGICEGHAYSVISCKEMGGFKYLMLRNPWGCLTHSMERVTDENGNETINQYHGVYTVDSTNGIFYIELNNFMNKYKIGGMTY